MQNIDPSDIVLNYTVVRDEIEDLYSVTFGLLDKVMVSSFRYVSVYSVAIGACLTLSLILWAITQNKRTPVFVLNQITLLLMVLRSSLFLAYSNGPFASLGYTFTGIALDTYYWSYRVVVAANAFQILLVTCIEASMTYQIYIMFRSPEVKRLGLVLTGLMTLLDMCVIGFYINSAVNNARLTLSSFDKIRETSIMGTWVSDVPVVLFSASVNLTSIMLICKLFCAIRSRRYMGLRQFDVFHILIIMSMQTLLIPSLLIIVNYGVTSVKDNILNTISMFIVVLSLPLTSMWASAANNSPTLSSSALSFLSRSSTNNSNTTAVENETSSLAKKLSKGSTLSPDLEKHLNSLPTTLTSFPRPVPLRKPSVNSLSPSCMPTEIRDILNDEAQGGYGPPYESPNSIQSDNSFDRALHEIHDGKFISRTSHKVRE